MKTLFRIFPLAVLMFSLSACLKDDLATGENNDSPNIVEFYNPTQAADADHIYPMVNTYFQVVPEGESEIIVSYSGIGVAPEDIVVKLKLDEAALNRYNDRIIQLMREELEEAGEDPADAEEYAELYTMMPTDLYTLSATQVTIKKGEKQAVVKVTVKPDHFDFAYRYVIPLTIESASSGIISGNFGTTMFFYGARNAYDGTYKNTYSRTRADGSVIVSGSNTVTYTTTGEFSIAGDLIGYYSNVQTMVIDPATNKVTVSSPGVAITDDKSYYDPETRTFYIEYTALGTLMKSTLVRQ